MIGPVIATVLVVITLVVVYLYVNQDKRPDEYIWVGEGEDPFKR